MDHTEIHTCQTQENNLEVDHSKHYVPSTSTPCNVAGKRKMRAVHVSSSVCGEVPVQNPTRTLKQGLQLRTVFF